MTTSQRVLPRVGERIQRYELLEEIGRGGFGVVFRARQHGLDIDVAVKVVLPQDADEAATMQLYERFKQEADIAKQLLHPNAIKVRDYGRTAGGLPFLVSEFVRGEGLDAIIGGSGISLERTIRIAMQVLGCLAEAHHRQIVHRDLKPANIMIQDMVGESDHVKVLDFGIAKLAEQVGGVQTQTGHALGTPYYMSPEQCRGKKDIDGRADLYSLGLVMAECLTGRRVVQTTDYMGAYYEHAKAEPLAFDPVVEQSPLFPVIRTATAKERDARYAGALEMREALEYLRVTVSQHLPGFPAPTMPGAPTLAAPPTPLSASMSVATAATAEQEPGDDELAGWRRGILIVLALVVIGSIVVAVWPRPDSPDADRHSATSRSSAVMTPESPESATPPVDAEATQSAANTPGEQAASQLRFGEGLVSATRQLHRAVPRSRDARITASEPATVSLGDLVSCETPCDLTLPIIDHEVRLSVRRPGYHEHAETVNLATFRQLDVELHALAEERGGEPEHRVEEPEVEEREDGDEEPTQIRRLTIPTGIRRLTVPGSDDESSESDDGSSRSDD